GDLAAPEGVLPDLGGTAPSDRLAALGPGGCVGRGHRGRGPAEHEPAGERPQPPDALPHQGAQDQVHPAGAHVRGPAHQSTSIRRFEYSAISGAIWRSPIAPPRRAGPPTLPSSVQVKQGISSIANSTVLPVQVRRRW